MYYFISYYYYYFKSILNNYFGNREVICADMLENEANLEKEIKIPDNFLSDNSGDLIEIRKIIDTIDIDSMYNNLQILSKRFDRKSDIEKIIEFLVQERNFNAEYENINNNYINHENSQNNINLLNELILNFTILKIVLKKMN